MPQLQPYTPYRIRLSQEDTSRQSHRRYSVKRQYSYLFFHCRDSQLAAQVDTLNKDYAKANVKFTLAGTDRTTNANWFNTVGPDSSLQTTMKKQVSYP